MSLSFEWKIIYLTQLGQLEFELVGAILGVLESLLQSLGAIVALNLLLQFAYSLSMLFGLCPKVMESAVKQLNLAFLWGISTDANASKHSKRTWSRALSVSVFSLSVSVAILEADASASASN